MMYAARFSINNPMSPRNKKSRRVKEMYGLRRPKRKISSNKPSFLSKILGYFAKWFMETFKIELPSHIANEIFFIIAVSVFIISVLALNSNAGPVGILWIDTSTSAIGLWGLYALLTWIAVMGVLHFVMRIEELLRGSMIVGFVIFLTGITGLFSKSFLSYDVLYDNVKDVGGYLGFFALFVTRSLLGHTGSTVVLSALVCVGIIMMSQVRFSDLIAHIIDFVTDIFKGNEIGNEITIRENQFIKSDEPSFETQLIKEEKMKVIEVKPKKLEVIEPKVIQSNDTEAWVFPSVDLLNDPVDAGNISEASLKDNADLIKEKLAQFNINVDVKEVEVGPTVMQYAIKPDESVKLSKIIGLKQDLALALATPNIRIEAPIQGKSLVGIEIPKTKRSPVMIKDLLSNMPIGMEADNLFMPLGKDVAGRPIVADLADMPHLLVAGSTGSGKSVCINSIIVSLLYQRSPKTLKFIMVDPKHVELTNYNGLPHLLTPVITDPGKAIGALKWACSEMDRRYKMLSKTGARNLKEYHDRFDEVNDEYLPTIVVLIDELADLMMSGNKKDTESYICRIAQKARAVGIHLIIATQRPSVDVITGLIKANFPSRIAFAVTAGVDSKTILDTVGAEDLLGRGDMLYLPKDLPKPLRIQGCLVTGKEIEGIMRHIKMHSLFDTTQGQLEFDEDGSEIKVMQSNGGLGISSVNHGGSITTLDIMEAGDDDSLIEAMKVVYKTGKASASLLQRAMRVGYARAASILDQLHDKGLIGPVNGAKPRDVYVDKFPIEIKDEINV